MPTGRAALQAASVLRRCSGLRRKPKMDLPPASRAFSTSAAPPLDAPPPPSPIAPHSDVFTVPRRTNDDAFEVAVVLNWRIPQCAPDVWRRADWRVCADGGANRLYDDQRRRSWGDEAPAPDAVCGDLDSVRSDVLAHFRDTGVTVHDLSGDQDTTDLQKCLSLARGVFRSKQHEHAKARLRVVALGALGGRLDHTLQNVNTLYTDDDGETPTELVLVGEHATARLLRGPATADDKWAEHAVPVDLAYEGPTCGLCALVDASNGRVGLRAVTSGLRWNLDGSEAMALGFGTLQSTSNIVEPVCVDEHGRGHVRVRCNGPLLWTTELKGSDKS